MSTPANTVTIDDIRRAARQIEGQVVRTPLIAAPQLSALTGAEIFVKYENLQFTNSFKDRGALVKLLSLDAGERRRGVIAMSAGNHAQAVAYHAGRLEIPATIVMPEHTPFVKVGNTESYGARVILSGATISECQEIAEEIAAREGQTLIHPYDDPLVIAGQGTVGLEVMADEPDLDALVIPIGGGGLISGSAVAATALKNGIEIVGVEARLFPSMHNAIKGAQLPAGGQTLAEGIAVKNIGAFTAPLVKAHVADILLVDEAQIEAAVCTFLTVQKTMAEGAGAASLAAILAEPERFRGKRIALYLSGGNIDPRILATIMVRGLERETKIVSLRITIADQPGQLGRIATLLGDAGANILEVSHRRLFLDVPAKGASIDLMIEIKDGAHARQVMARLEEAGFNAVVLQNPGGRHLGVT